MKFEAPERIWIESEGECPYFYDEEELSDVAPPITEYVRADKLEELAAEIEALRTDLMESDEIREKLGHLLTRTAAALKGEPPEGVWHSWHDLPEKAAQLAERVQRDEDLLRQALEALDVYREYDPDGGGVADKVAAALRERLGLRYEPTPNEGSEP